LPNSSSLLHLSYHTLFHGFLQTTFSNQGHSLDSKRIKNMYFIEILHILEMTSLEIWVLHLVRVERKSKKKTQGFWVIFNQTRDSSNRSACACYICNPWSWQIGVSFADLCPIYTLSFLYTSLIFCDNYKTNWRYLK